MDKLEFVPKCQCARCDLRDMFFGFVEEEEMDSICISRKEVQHSKGDSIIIAGEKISEFIYLKEGLVKLSHSNESGKTQIIAIGKPFDLVSILGVFSDDRYKFSVAAIADSVTCNIDINYITNLAKENGKFALNVMKKLGGVSDQVIIDFLEIRKKLLKGRVAHVLLLFYQDIYKTEIFDLPISRKEFADFIGMTTENVIRTLSEFRKDKIIRIYGKSIEILELGRLEAISEHG